MTAPALFSDAVIQKIVSALPEGADGRRLKLLPRMLREWADSDLMEYFAIATTTTRHNRINGLDAVSKCALELSHSLHNLDSNRDAFWLLCEMPIAKGKRLTLTPQLRELRDFLNELSTAATKAAKKWELGRGQPRKTAASFVISDIAAIYEWVTESEFTRQTGRGKSDYGPSWKFASALWPVVFGQADDGLHNAMKNWASARKKVRERPEGSEWLEEWAGLESPIISNLHSRYPEWGIFKD